MRLVPIGYWAVPTAGETTCFLLEEDGMAMLLDTGMNPAYGVTQAGRKLVDITYVFLSHCHADHMSGFASFVFCRQVQERATGPASRLIVLGSEQTISAGRTLLDVMYPDRSFDLEWIVVSPSAPLALGHLRAEFMFTDHTVPGVAVRMIDANRIRFVFTSDTSASDALVKFCSGADLLLGECFGTTSDFGPVMEVQKHLSASAVGELAQRADAKKLVLFHMHQPYRNPEKRDELLAEVAGSFKGETIFPTDAQDVEF